MSPPTTPAPIPRYPGVLGLAAGLLLAVAAAGSAATAPRAAVGDLFERYDVVTGAAKRPTTLTGFLLDGAIAELAVVDIDEKDDRRLRIYGLGDGTLDPRTCWCRRAGTNCASFSAYRGRTCSPGGPKKVAVAMPNEEYTCLVDLNKDGKEDVLMHHPSTTEPHRLTVLIAR